MDRSTTSPKLISRRDAKRLGLKRYFTGRPCKYGHVDERLVSNGNCVTCDMAACSQQYRKHREKRLAQQATYRVLNADKRLAANRAYMAANREALRLKSSKFYHENRPEVLRRRRELNQQPERKLIKAQQDKAYAKANRPLRTVIGRRYRARLHSADGNHTLEQIRDLLERQKYRCIGCGKSIRKGFHADHIVPLILGGSNDISNIQLLCPRCNTSKGGKDPLMWAQTEGRLL